TTTRISPAPVLYALPILQRVALDRDPVAVALQVVELHELARHQPLDEHCQAAGVGFAEEGLLDVERDPAAVGDQVEGAVEGGHRSEEHTSELQSREKLVC